MSEENVVLEDSVRVEERGGVKYLVLPGGIEFAMPNIEKKRVKIGEYRQLVDNLENHFRRLQIFGFHRIGLSGFENIVEVVKSSLQELENSYCNLAKPQYKEKADSLIKQVKEYLSNLQ